VKRLRQLEQANGRLKNMVGDRDLDIDAFKRPREQIVGARVRRQQVAYAEWRGLSHGRAWALL
jgi:hypothetical protein